MSFVEYIWDSILQKWVRKSVVLNVEYSVAVTKKNKVEGLSFLDCEKIFLIWTLSQTKIEVEIVVLVEQNDDQMLFTANP